MGEPNQIDTLVKSVSDLSGKIDDFVTKPEVEPLQKSINDLSTEITSLKAELKVGNDNRTEDPFNGFKHQGEFAHAVMKAADPRNKVVDERLLVKAVTGMSLTTGPDGGYTYPPGFSTQIEDDMRLISENLLERTDRIPLDGVESMTLLANAETSRVNGSRWGGVQGYWKSEAGQMTASKPTFRTYKLEPQELYVFVYATDKLLRNSPAHLEGYIRAAAADEIQFKVGDAIYNGLGAGMPKGLMIAGSKVSVAKETNQAAASLLEENITKMYSRLHPRFRDGAEWLVNIDVEPQLDLMNRQVLNRAGTENVGGFKSMLWNPGNRTLKGLPVKTCEYSATLGTQGDIVLWNPKQYATATKGGINSAMSIHLRFDYNESCFRFIFEVDGQSKHLSPLTPFKGSNTLTNIVLLDTRA